MIDDLTRQLSTMLGDDAGVGGAKITDASGLWPGEAEAIARAIPKRRAEFAAGRRAARLALTDLEEPETAILKGPDRAPRWPAGLRGAITHDRGLALAAVTRAAGIGIDLTEADPLPGETRKTILPHAGEAGLDPLAARAGFSAKETLFKALFPLVGAPFGFSAAEVRPDLAAGRFGIRLTTALGDFPEGAEWQGRLAVRDGIILTSLIIETAKPGKAATKEGIRSNC